MTSRTELIMTQQQIQSKLAEVDQRRALMPQGGGDHLAEAQVAEAQQGLVLAMAAEHTALWRVETDLDAKMRAECRAALLERLALTKFQEWPRMVKRASLAAKTCEKKAAIQISETTARAEAESGAQVVSHGRIHAKMASYPEVEVSSI